MRKMALLLALWFCFSVGFASKAMADRFDGKYETDDDAVFILPASLKEIHESAFEGTSVKMVVIPDSTETIGDRAFANIKTLWTVCIPESVRYIGDNAFAGSLNVIVKGAEDSYASYWAQKHHVPFVQEEIVSSLLAKLGKLLQGGAFLAFSLSCVCPKAQFWQRRKTKTRERSMRPQDRPELYPINYRFP